jgi:nicotinamide riboside transporter PnuC
VTRRRRWDPPQQRPKRPYRDSAILYAVLAVVIVVVAVLTGGGLARAIGFALAFFLLATGWSWWRWRTRLADVRRRTP